MIQFATTINEVLIQRFSNYSKKLILYLLFITFITLLHFIHFMSGINI